MNFALLGTDPDALALAAAVARAPGDRLVAAWGLGTDAGAVAALAPELELVESWESLCGGTLAEAAIVARPRSPEEQELSGEQLRRLAQAGVAAVVAHPAHSSVLLYYELDMIRRETGAVLLPSIRSRWHPAVAEFRALYASGSLGEVEQMVFQRGMSDRRPGSVRAQFAVDVDLARNLCGELNRLGAMGPAADAEAYTGLGVQLSGPGGGPVVRWSLGPVEECNGGRVTLAGSKGQAVLEMPADGSDWTIAVKQDGQSRREAYSGSGVPDAMLAALRAAVAGEAARPTWTDACRDLELADSIERSLRKGKFLELHYEDYTEQGTFKGTMTSLGCGLLLAGLVLLAAAALALRLGYSWAAYVPHALLAVLALFLVFQLMLKLVYPAEKD